MLMNIMTKLKSFAKDENGASAIEYAVIAAVVVVVIIDALNIIDIEAMFTGIKAAIDGA